MSSPAYTSSSSPFLRELFFFFFFFNDTATTEIYTLSLHDALPICDPRRLGHRGVPARLWRPAAARRRLREWHARSEEHTSELQSLAYLVCRLLLEKKKKKNTATTAVHNARKLVHRPGTLRSIHHLY